MYLFSNYATDATDATVGAIQSDELMKKDLAGVIDELNKIVPNENHSYRRLTQHELKTLLNRMKIQKPSAEQALNILRLCSFGRTDLSVCAVVKKIWHELQDIMNADEIHTQHYNYLLKFASERQDMKDTQAIFDEMIANGNEPNT